MAIRVTLRRSLTFCGAGRTQDAILRHIPLARIPSPEADDWRAMVDSLMKDTAYDGEVFNVFLADVPERKIDLVTSVYELAASDGKTAVPVKIANMLGEEIFKTLSVQNIQAALRQARTLKEADMLVLIAKIIRWGGVALALFATLVGRLT